MGRFDVPAFVDLIQETTGRDKITYIGHSEGTTQFFLGASLMPDYYAEKFNLFMALAPVASTANIPIWYIRLAAHHVSLIKFWIVGVFNWYNWIPPLTNLVKFSENVCGKPLVSGICRDIFKTMHHDGVDDVQSAFNFISNEPSGDSYRTFEYYAQMIVSGQFNLFDYGHRENKKIYG